MTNARGQKREYSFDDAGRIKSFTDPEGTTSYTYDANGNILTVTDSVGTITRQYDALNRVIEVTDTAGNVVKYAYDAVGNLSSLTYPGGKVVSYSYDADNRLTAVTDWAKRVTAYSYEANGRLIKTVRPDGSVFTQSYDKAGHLISAADKDASGNIISDYNYSYDANGNILIENSTTSGTDNAAMVYDALNRLTSKSDKDTSGTALASYAYAYDADGNITSGKSAQQTAAMTYDVLDRLSAYNGNNPAFDLDGNLTSCTLGGSVVSFAYDSGNRLTQAGTTAYTYDVNDNRIALAVSNSKTQYAYENVAAKLSQLLVRTNPDGSQTFYVYGLGLIGQQDSTGYSVYHFDFRGNTVALTNSSGTVTDRFTYGAYGELLTHTGSSDTPFLYNGRDGVLTDANGLYYMRARYYSPELKRFLNTDTKKGSIDKIQTLNFYSFVVGNPSSLIDPLGLSSELSENEPLIGSTVSTYYDIATLYEKYVNSGYYSIHTTSKAGLKTTVGKEGKLLTYDPYFKGMESGLSFEAANTNVDISLGSVSVGQTIKDVTTSYGFNFLTGSITVGTEVEFKSNKSGEYGNSYRFVSTEKTFNINWSKIAQQAVVGAENRVTSSAHQVASAFQRVGADITNKDFTKGLADSAYAFFAVGSLVAAAGVLIALLDPVK